MLKLKLNSSVLVSDANRRLIGKIPDAGKDRGQKEKGHQRMRWLDGITDAV